MEEPDKNLRLQSPGVKKKKKKATPPKKKPAKNSPSSEIADATKKGANGPLSPTTLRSTSNDGASNTKSSLQGSTSPDGLLPCYGTPVTQKRSLGKQTHCSSSVPSKRPNSRFLEKGRSLPGANQTMVLPRSPSSSSLGSSSRNWRNLAWDGSMLSGAAVSPKRKIESDRIATERRMPEKAPPRIHNELVRPSQQQQQHRKSQQQQHRKNGSTPSLQSPKWSPTSPGISPAKPKVSPATPPIRQPTTRQFSERQSLATKSAPLESPRRGKSLRSSKATSTEDSRSPGKRKNGIITAPNGRDVLKNPKSLPRAASSIGLVSNGAGVGGDRSVRRCKSGDLELMRHREPRGFEARPSILKHSSHHQRTLRNPRIDAKRSPKTRFLTTAATMSDDDDSFGEIPVKFDDEPARSRPRSPRPGLTSFRQGSRSQLSRTRSGLLESTGYSFKSAKSMMSQDKGEDFSTDPRWKKFLRYIRILAPTGDESPDKKRIRIYIWCTLCLDLLAAVVSLVTSRGVPICCGKPIFSLKMKEVPFDWNKAIKIMAYVYIAMIFVEIIPVVRKGLPFNVLNPMVGFAITIALFFNDHIKGAVCMWVIEFAAICFEILVYCLERKLYHQRCDRLQEIQMDLQPSLGRRTLSSSTKTRSLSSSNSSHRLKRTSNHSSDDDSLSGRSFEGEESEKDLERQMHDSSAMNQSYNHKVRETRLLRERRMLRERQAGDRTRLWYHLMGVILNITLICTSLILIIVIASSGGLCISTDYPVKVFDMNQFDRCPACRGNINSNGTCEVCNDNGSYQCYYQYI